MKKTGGYSFHPSLGRVDPSGTTGRSDVRWPSSPFVTSELEYLHSRSELAAASKHMEGNPVKIRLFLVLLAISTTLGCAAHTARLYPVQGPLSAQTPAPVLIAKISGTFTPGDIFVTMPDGEV
jgi:hypothetical protein